MHGYNKSPISKTFHNATAFQNRRRRDDKTGIAAISAAAAILIQARAIGGHGGQRLKLPVGHILDNRRILELTFIIAAAAGVVSSLESDDCGDGGVWAVDGALDHDGELRNLDGLVGEDLDLVMRLWIGGRLRVRVVVLVLRIVVVVFFGGGIGVFFVVVVFFVVMVLVLLLTLADLGFSLPLPPFGSVFCQKNK